MGGHDADLDIRTRPGSSSFVYPTRSLLTGIQPATTAESPSTDHHLDPNKLSASTSDHLSLHDLLTLQLGKSLKKIPGSQCKVSKSLSNVPDSASNPNRRSSTPLLSKRRQDKAITPDFRCRSIEDLPSPFRDFSPEDSESSSRQHTTFVFSPARSSFRHDPPTSTEQSLISAPVVVEPEPDTCHPTPTDRFHSVQLGTLADPFYETVTASETKPLVPLAMYSNLSQSGIVHLAPIGSSSGSSSRGSHSDKRLFATHGSNISSFVNSGSSSDRRRQRSLKSNSPGVSPTPDESYVQRSSSHILPVSDDLKSLAVNSSSVDEQSSKENFFTVRYQYAQDENGHHVVVGREGQITRCEDEPIRTPGAIQAFGVLIAVTEDEEAETLVVRQVSENSLDILGLSPHYLFSLESFTDTLPDSQANMLWDNVQFLNDSHPSEDQEDNAHVFLLSGWGEPGSDNLGNDSYHRREWTCWCAIHRPIVEDPTASSIIVLEFELERDLINPLEPPLLDNQSGGSSPRSGSIGSGTALISSYSDGGVPSLTTSVRSDHRTSSTSYESSPPKTSEVNADCRSRASLEPQEIDEWIPTPEEILASTTSRSKPLTALERLRRVGLVPGAADATVSGLACRGRHRRSAGKRKVGGGVVGMMDLFAIMAQINEQLGAADDLDIFLGVVVGVVKDLTLFDRVTVYQFDDAWNGQVVAELVDWSQTHDLYRGLHFPAGDIPAQARRLYAANKVRLLYDRCQPTARLVARDKLEIETLFDMSHCYLRAMSPIHLKYLENMGVRASMSVSIMAFGTIWGLVTCHSYGLHGRRVPFPVRQMLRLLSQAISKNIERLSYAQRLQTRKLINTLPTDQHPSGYIVSNADDLLGLFDADYGVLVIGEGAKILGPNEHGQEVLIIAEYLRLKRYNVVQISQAVTTDFPDLQLSTGLEVISGLLYVPLSSGGCDFIAFLRKGQLREVRWAGKPYEDGKAGNLTLEPRASFKIWSEITSGRCRSWTDEQVETASVLALVYGKFIEVWRQKESMLQTNKLTSILLSNASHEVRTPLNHIINYLELALNGPLDGETREHLNESHAASKSLLFTINDLLDLTRLESGQDTSFNEPFNLHRAIEEAIQIYRNEAERRSIRFVFNVSGPKMVIGDSKKIRTVVANLTANALKYSDEGTITVECRSFGEPEGLRDSKSVAVEIVVADTGCGIPASKLESIFREFEQVDSASPKTDPSPGLGLGLAVVARIVEQLGGQLRVESKVNEGSRFSTLIPFTVLDDISLSPPSSSGSHSDLRSSSSSGSEIDSLVSALQMNNVATSVTRSKSSCRSIRDRGEFEVQDSNRPVRPVKVEMNAATSRKPGRNSSWGKDKTLPSTQSHARKRILSSNGAFHASLRILVVEDNEINSKILGKRLTLDGHTVVHATNGQHGVDVITSDREFDCVLMDIQMPLLNGYEATKRIRILEKSTEPVRRSSHLLNGRLPIFAVSASLLENKRKEMSDFGMDGWILKPIDFKRLRVILSGITDTLRRQENLYCEGHNWESGGWLTPYTAAT